MKELIGKAAVTIPVGPIVSNSDGLTPVTDLTLSGADEKAIRKYGNATPVSISGNTFAAITSMDGHYDLTLTNSQMDTYGMARISIQDDSKCLPYFEDIAIVTSAYWHSKYNTNPWALADAVSSLDTRVSSIGVEVDSIQAQVTSTYNKLSDFPVSGYLPSSETLNAHIATLPTSQTLNAHIVTLPTSSVLDTQIGTLPISGYVPSSETLNAHIATLATSETLNAHIITLPTSAELNDHIATLPLSSHVADLPNSQTLNAHIATLPTSATLEAQINTLPTSETLNAHIVTLPTSGELNDHIVTLPTSEAAGTIADKALSDVNLDHLMKTVVADSGDLTNEVADFSVLGLMMAAGGDVSNFVSSDDSLQGISEGAAGGGASASEVQSACFDVIQDMNLDHLMKTIVADSSDLTTEVADFSVLSLIMASGGDTSAFVSSDDSLQGISEGAAGGGASASEVQSACYTAMNDHYVVNVGSIDVVVGSLDVRVTSIAVEIDSVQSQVQSTYNRLGDFPVSGYLPSSQTLNAHIGTLPTSEGLRTEISTLPNSQTLNAHISTLPTSQELNAHIITLPTSGVLNDHIATLPTSQTLEAQINTLPTSETLQTHIATLPTSETLNAHIVTLPNSQTVMNAISSMDTRVISLDVHVGSLATEIFATEVESGYSLLRKQRIDMSVLTGITSGGGTSTLHFRDVSDSKARLIVTVDSDGNRTAVNTLDGS